MTHIFYFSGTGNSLKVARDLAQELGDAKITFIPKAIRDGIDLSAERIGIIYPVYAFGMPLIVSRFIASLKPVDRKYIFAVATYACYPGWTLVENARLLAKTGLKLSAGFLIYMPDNYIPFFGAIKEAKQKQIFQWEEKHIKVIAEIIRRDEEIKVRPYMFYTSIIYGSFIRSRYHSGDKSFSTDETCNSCGICVKLCPVDNIKLNSGKPYWLHKCEHCLTCLQWCPKESIQYTRLTKSKKRYHNPHVTLEDMLAAKA